MSEDETKDARIDRAAEAHRDERHGRSDRAASTRARVLATHGEATRRTTTLWWAAAAAVIVFLGVPTAWAWSTGRLPGWIGGRDDAPPPSGAALPRARSELGPVEEPHGGRASPGTAVDPPRLEVSPSAAASGDGESLAPGERLEPGAREEVLEQSPGVEGASASTPAVDPLERRAFERADALHTARDFPAALDAWDAYLVDHPRGRFAIEARYERAICLVRLGRQDEAIRALTPFAEGRHGHYREAEARALLDVLAGPVVPE